MSRRLNPLFRGADQRIRIYSLGSKFLKIGFKRRNPRIGDQYSPKKGLGGRYGGSIDPRKLPIIKGGGSRINKESAGK